MSKYKLSEEKLNKLSKEIAKGYSNIGGYNVLAEDVYPRGYRTAEETLIPLLEEKDKEIERLKKQLSKENPNVY